MQVRRLRARVARASEHLPALHLVPHADAERPPLDVHVLAELVLGVLDDDRVRLERLAEDGVVGKVVDGAHDDAVGRREELGAEAVPVLHAPSAADVGPVPVVELHEVERVGGVPLVRRAALVALADGPGSLEG